MKEQPKSIAELAEQFRGNPKWDAFRKPEPPVFIDTRILEADRENPSLGFERRGVIFNPDESEGARE